MMNWLRQPATPTQITHGKRLWLYVISGLVMLFLILPTLIVIPMSFSESQYLEFPPREWSLRWYKNYFGSTSWMLATATSFKAGFLTMILSTLVGTMAAYGLHTARMRFSGLVFSILLTPIVVPIILVGIGVFYVYVKLGLVNTMAGIVLAHSMLAIPLVVMVVSSALKSYDMNQERVARSLGASRTYAFFFVTLPQIRFSVISGAVLSFLTSFDEVIVSLFISGGENSTLTRNMFAALRDQIDPTIAAISTLVVVLTSILLAISQIFGKNSALPD
ncbi:MAG: ABC transporter permease [Rhizobiales bacterium PAR1]|nr:MAG: ABC transporter permease [Rhizobiales bacterium PAR1]